MDYPENILGGGRPQTSRLEAGRLKQLASTPSKIPRRLRVALIFGGFVLCLGALAWLAYKTSQKINLDELNPYNFLWALLAGIGYFVLIACGWIALSGQQDVKSAFSNWSRTQALHFVPGGILTPASRAYTLNANKSKRIWSVVIETLLETSLAASVAALAMSVTVSRYYALIGLVSVVIVAILINLKSKTTISSRSVVIATLWLFAGRCSYCLAIFYGQLSIGPNSVSFWDITFVSALSWLAGYVAIFSPGGIGVREVVYAKLLSSGKYGLHLSTSIASAGALAGRLALSLAELIVLVCTGTYSKEPPSTPEQVQAQQA